MSCGYFVIALWSCSLVVVGKVLVVRRCSGSIKLATLGNSGKSGEEKV